MKNIIRQVGFVLLFAAPLAAEDYPVDMMLKEMGFMSPEISVNVANDIKRSNDNVKAFYSEQKKKKEQKKLAETVLSQVKFEQENILYPRITEASESPEMIPVLLRYHKANPKSEKITKKLAVATYSIGQYKEALYWYTLTYQRNRNDMESLWNMATIADSMGEKKQAKVYLTEYIKSDSGSIWGKKARSLLKSGYLEKDDKEYFEKEISNLLDTNPVIEAKSQNNYVSITPTESKTANNHMMLISANEDDFDNFVAPYKSKRNFYGNAAKDGDTLKGNGQPKLEENVKGVESSLSDIEEASKKITLSSKPVIQTKTSRVKSSEASQKTEDEKVKIVSAPLGN